MREKERRESREKEREERVSDEREKREIVHDRRTRRGLFCFVFSFSSQTQDLTFNPSGILRELPVFCKVIHFAKRSSLRRRNVYRVSHSSHLGKRPERINL